MSTNQGQVQASGRKFRIDGFRQQREFWEIVVDGEITPGLTSTHIAVYQFLLNTGNNLMWPTWISLPRESIMHAARIKDKKTYYKVIHDLENYGLIETRKGIANKTAAQYKIIKLPVPFNPTNPPTN
jgi:hypothetical protein